MDIDMEIINTNKKVELPWWRDVPPSYAALEVDLFAVKLPEAYLPPWRYMNRDIFFCYLALYHSLISNSPFDLPDMINQRYSNSHIYAEMVVNAIHLYKQFHIPFLHIVGKVLPLDNSGISTVVIRLQS